MLLKLRLKLCRNQENRVGKTPHFDYIEYYTRNTIYQMKVLSLLMSAQS